jgi:hypothetical protein
MKNDESYVIFTNVGHAELAKDINNAIRCGFTLQGGVTVYYHHMGQSSRVVWAQAMRCPTITLWDRFAKWWSE